MKHAQSIAAVRLVLPDFGRRKVRFIRSADGRVNLKRRAWLRAFSLWLRPVNYVALVLSLFVMFAGENAAAVPYILLLGLFVFLFETGAAAPRQRRQARILRDVRPILMQPIIQLPDMKRAGRILRTQPDVDIPALPPDRPRTRVSERRPGPYEEAYD